MKNEKVKYGLMSAICLILLALVAAFSYANRITEATDILVPSQYIFEGMSYWYVILIGVIAETAVIKYSLKETYLKAVSITLMMNAVSAVIGIVALHIASLVVELLFIPFSVGTFHVSHWIVNFIVIILMNACIEGLTAKIAFKQKFKKMFSWLCLANAISFIICILFNLSWISEMFF